MKINPLSDAFRFLNSIPLIKSKTSTDERDGGGNPHQQHPQQDRKDPDSDPETFTVTDETVGQAVDAFRSDSQNQLHGLEAAVDGQGPGIRISLKDVNGKVIRQFTGEEFLKLREATTKDGRTRGKILDQKL